MDNLENLNSLDNEKAKSELTRCCGSSQWVNKMLGFMPFLNKDSLFKKADEVWYSLSKNDWLEAFTHHPKIGDVGDLAKKFATTANWSEGEQSGVRTAETNTIYELSDFNKVYEDNFGYIFIVCATGKTAAEMLALLKARVNNDPDEEIMIAIGEQAKITKIRLEKLISSI